MFISVLGPVFGQCWGPCLGLFLVYAWVHVLVQFGCIVESMLNPWLSIFISICVPVFGQC